MFDDHDDFGADTQTATNAEGKKSAYCSFCRKSHREVGPLVEGPGDVYICGECVDLCKTILEQERQRRRGTEKAPNKIPSPRELLAKPDEYLTTLYGDWHQIPPKEKQQIHSMLILPTLVEHPVAE